MTVNGVCMLENGIAIQTVSEAGRSTIMWRSASAWYAASTSAGSAARARAVSATDGAAEVFTIWP